MTDNQIKIQDVSDTALWVAHYRAIEGDRPDALFHDPLAKVLAGERGQQIAESMKGMSRFTQWSVVSRTVIIDKFIQELIAEGVDTVLNLGAGLDTRPYRMNLPHELQWIEVDYPKIISLKNNLLASQKATCQSKRIEMDLADVAKRQELFAQVNASAKKILVITEGVIPYLNEEQVHSLGTDLKAQPHFAFWITEYFSPEVYRYIKSRARTQKMKNAPFLFTPPDWMGFFAKSGWLPYKIRYNSEVAEESGRKVPLPWFAHVFKIFASKSFKEKSRKMSGYMIFHRPSF